MTITLLPPRRQKNYRPRGPKRFAYTYEDIARLSGFSLRTVKAYGTGARRRYDPTDLGSVVAFLAEHKGTAPGSVPCPNGSSRPSSRVALTPSAPRSRWRS